jgi:hypothetical protein
MLHHAVGAHQRVKVQEVTRQGSAPAKIQEAKGQEAKRLEATIQEAKRKRSTFDGGVRQFQQHR